MLTADTTVTWSLLGESNSDYGLTKAACSPLPLSRHELAGLESNRRRRTVQSRSAPADRATGQWSPRRVPPSASGFTKVRPVLGPRGPVCQAGFEPATSRPSTWRLCLLGYKHMEPPPGADPGHPPYEGGAAAVRGGKATGAGIEPAWPRFRALMGCQQPTRYQCGRRESNAQAARFEIARYTSSLHSRMVRHQGLEP